MKRAFLFFVAMLCCGMIAIAVPAKPGWQKLTQSDGTTLTVRAVGNAFNNAILTTDGLTVKRGKDGDFYYSSSLTGLTAMRAHDVDQRTPAEVAFVQAQRGNLKMNHVERLRLPPHSNRLGVGGSNADADVPANGNRKIPIILVEFKDKKFNNTRQGIIDAMLTGNESVRQYFRDQSNGLYQPDFDVYGIYSLSQNREYYGGHSGSNNDRGLGYMVTEACQLAAADGVSFRPYDTNNDNYCDVVIVIYAGVGEAQAYWNHPEAIWPCNWYLSSASYYGMGGNGAFRPNSGDPYVDMFAVFNELHGSNDNTTAIDGIGTFAHEFGHCLGLPDFYDTDDGPHYGMGYWDIMCSGCYNNDGFTPVGYTAYEKAFMGWVDYVNPQPGTYYTLPVWNQKNAETDKAIRIVSPLNENEFFIIENRKRQGWDRYMAGEGLLITHVTYSAERWWGNTPNNQDVQLMTFIPADNTFSYYDENTDLWPQGSNNAFTDNSTPPARLYMNSRGSISSNAGLLGKPVTEMVINPDGTASFWYMKGSATNPVISVSTNAIDMGSVKINNSSTHTFNVIGQALTGDVTLTLNDPNGVFSIDPTVISNANASIGTNVTVTFSPHAIRDYSATVTVSSPGAQNVVVTLTGHGLIEGYTPVMLPANEDYINLTEFRADWTDQTPAQNVESYTLEVSTKPLVDLLETADFSNIPNAVSGGYLTDISDNYANYLPEGWSATSFTGAYDGAVLLAFDGSLITPTYNFSGYDKVTVVVRASSYAEAQATMSVSTSCGFEEVTLGENYVDYTIVLDCAAQDAITFLDLENYCNIRSVEIYAGDLTAVSLKASEVGDANYRLITGISDKFYQVRDLMPEGTFIYKVKSVFSDGTESPWSNVETVTLFNNGPLTPTIKVSTTDLDLGNVMLGHSTSSTFNVSGIALTGDVTLTLNDSLSVFGIAPLVISMDDATAGCEVTVYFAPQDLQGYEATLTLSSPDAEDVVVNLTGQGVMETYVPVMQPTSENFIDLTKFRAEWKDMTPAQNVESYTLEVNMQVQPVVELLETADFSNLPNVVDGNYLVDISGNYADYLPQGWSGTTYMAAYNGAVILAYGATLSTPTYDFTGFDKVTVVVRSSSYGGGQASMIVSTSQGSEQVVVGGDYEDYTIVLDCAGQDGVTFTDLDNYVNIKQVEIYAGDLTAVSLKANESGDSTYRYITGITNQSYWVRNLQSEGTFTYKVKAVYNDGTESPWSNVETVTLFGHGHMMGDVNHDNTLDVLDVTLLIGYILGNNDENECCILCGNADQDDQETIDVGDVTTLISLILMGD